MIWDRMLTRLLKFWNDHKKGIKESLIAGLILIAITCIGSWIHKSKEISRNDKEAKEEIYYGQYSAYFQASYDLCISLLKKNYCHKNYEINLKEEWLEGLKDSNEKRHIEGFFFDLATYYKTCSNLSINQQEEQVNDLYFRARSDPYLIHHMALEAKTSFPGLFIPDIRKAPSVSAEECDLYLQNLKLIKEHTESTGARFEIY